jgi:hypothetical protein
MRWWVGKDSALASWWGHIAATAVLLGLVVLVYRPSTSHAPRGDQWCFLLDTIDQHDFLSILARSYSYNRTRAVDPGDYQLFRPVLFVLLSAEKALFGNNFALWQWTGIALHGLAVFLLLAILLSVRRILGPPGESRLLSCVAYGIALFFGLNFAGIEMVIWSHINGYLLFVVFALGALLLSLWVLANPAAPLARLALLAAGAVLLVGLSAFTYEIGQFFAVLLGTALGTAAWMHGARLRGVVLFALFASVLLLYQGMNLLDHAAHPQAWDASMTTVLERAGTPQTLEHTGRYVLYTAVQPFFPSTATWKFAGRVVIPEPVFSWETFSQAGPLPAVSLVVCAMGILLAARGFIRVLRAPERVSRLLIVLLPLSLFVLHAGATVLGRMNLRPGPQVISSNSYYAYLPLLALLTALYGTWACASRSLASVVILVGLVVLSSDSGTKVYRMNVEVKKALKPLRVMTSTLNQFIEQHGDEPGFSFALGRPACAGVESFHGIPLPIILYKRYLDNHQPRYLFLREGDQLVARTCDEADHHGHIQIYPDLVRVGTHRNFFYFDGWYYAVQPRDGYYSPDREDHIDLIRARTLAGARRQAAHHHTRERGPRQ